MRRFPLLIRLLNHHLRRHIRRRNDNPRMAAMAPFVLSVLDHVHLVTPFGDVWCGLEVH